MTEETVFAAALAKNDPAERAAYLDEVCAGDAALRQQVELLLKAHAADDQFLAVPAAAQLAPASRSTGEMTEEMESLPARSADSHGPTAEVRRAAQDEQPLSFLAPPRKPGSLGRLDHYDILEVVGHGGMGVVLKAFDDKLHRVAAIKVLAPQMAASGTARKRFVREAQAAAAVAHDHVVAIHAVEDAGPVPYLVMHYVAGISLEDRIKQGGPLELKEILRIGIQTAAGLAAAHAQGLVHRDIKPANILLENGVQRVKITDFGLARAVDDASLTQSGVIAGTPMYMSPEQARGEMVDHRSDLFSLGSVLYTLCAGRPPFRASSSLAVLKRVNEETPRAIREINPDIPDWLVAIIARLHAKEPAERFQSAAEVAELLSQHLAHLQQPEGVPLPPPIVPPAPAPRRRRRMGIAVAAAVLLLAAGALAYRMFSRGEREPVAQGPSVVKGTDEAFDRLKRADIPPALLALAGGDPEQAPPELVAVLGGSSFHLPAVTSRGPITQRADGRLLAAACGDNLYRFDAQTGESRGVLMGHTAPVTRGVFTPDNKRIITTSRDQSIRVWDAATGRETLCLQRHTGPVTGGALSPDGKRFASAGADQTVLVWDTDFRQDPLVLRGHTAAVFPTVFSPDGKWLVSGSEDRTVRVWNAETGAETRVLQGHTLCVLWVAFSPDGKLLATGSDAELKLYNGETFEEIRTLAEPAGWLAFAPDGKTLWTAKHNHAPGERYTVTRWDAAGWTKQKTLPLKSQGGWGFYCLSSDGKTLFANAHTDTCVRAYDTETGEERLPRRGHDGPVEGVAVSPNGRLLASAGNDRTVKLWDLASWKAGEPLPPVQTLQPRTASKGPIRSVVFSPDGKFLAWASADGTLVLWDVISQRQHRSLRGNVSYRSRIAFSRNGQTLAAGGFDSKVRRWEVAGGKPVGEPIPAHGSNHVRAVAYSPDDKLLVSGGEDGWVRLWEMPDGGLVNELACNARVTSVAFSTDGKTLIAATDNPEAKLVVWDVTDPGNARVKAELRGHTSDVVACALQPDGALAASGSYDGTVRLWDLASGGGRMLSIASAGGARVHNVVFSPEGRYLVTGNDNGTLSILKVPAPPAAYAPGAPVPLPDPVELAKRPSPADALKREDIPAELLQKAAAAAGGEAPPELVAVLPYGSQSTASVAFSPDGKFLAAGGADQCAKIWDLATGKLLHTLPVPCRTAFEVAFVRAPGKGGSSALLLATTDTEDRTVRLRDVETGKELHVLVGFTAHVLHVAASPDGRWLAAADTARLVQIWDPTTGKRLRTLRRPACTYGDLAASPDGRLLATADDDGSVRLWDPVSGWLLATLAGHQGPVRGLAFLGDGRTLASSGQTDHTVRLWDLGTLRQKQVLGGTRTLACKVVWRADGRLLAADDHAEGKVRLWDFSAAPPRHKALALAGFEIHGIALSPEGRYLATVNRDGTVYILRLAKRGEVFQVPPDAKE